MITFLFWQHWWYYIGTVVEQATNEIPSYRLQFLGYINNGGMKSLPQRGSFYTDVCEPGCNLCFLIQHQQLGSSVLSKSSPSFCIPYPPSPTLLRSVYTPFFLFPLHLLTLSKGFILPEYKYTQESSILKNHPPSLLLPRPLSPLPFMESYLNE